MLFLTSDSRRKGTGFLGISCGSQESRWREWVCDLPDWYQCFLSYLYCFDTNDWVAAWQKRHLACTKPLPVYLRNYILFRGNRPNPKKTQKMKTGYTELYYAKFRFWLQPCRSTEWTDWLTVTFVFIGLLSCFILCNYTSLYSFYSVRYYRRAMHS